MALVLSLREGEDFFAGDQRIVMGPRGYVLSFFVKVNGFTYGITPNEWTEVYPGVHCRASMHAGTNPSMHRIEINAPGLLVLNGSKYTQRKEAS